MRESNFMSLCRSVCAGVLLSSAGACSIFTPVEVAPMTEYQLTAAIPDGSSCKSSTFETILQVTEVRADAPFNNRKMYYSESQYQLSSYALSEWVAHPNVMLTQAIQEKLLASCIYSNVVNAEFMTTAKYRLTSQLLDFKQVVNGQSSTMQLSILVQLVDNSSNKVVRGKTFETKAETSSTPAGYVKGADMVTQTFLNDLTSWLSSN